MSYKNTDGVFVTEQLTINKQIPSDVYCQPCHDVGAYFRMQQETFYDHLKREHNAIINAPVTCNFCHQKFNNLNAIRKHVLKYRVAVTMRRVHQPDTNSGQHESRYGYYRPAAHSDDRIGIPGWAPITEALAIARVGVVPVEINYCCLGASVS